jgi:hypothetical protein
MKASSLFWGSFLVFLGIFFLLDNFNVLELRLTDIIKFWPLLLIVWGIALLKIPDVIKKILSSFSGIFLAVIIISLFNIRIGDIVEFPNREITINDVLNDSSMTFYHSSYSSANIIDSSDSTNQINNRIISLEFDAGVGNFVFEGYTDELVEVKSANAKSEVKVTTDDSNTNIDVQYGEDQITINSMEDLEKIGKNRYAKVLLNKNPIWDIEIDAGASKLNLNFKDKKVKNISIDAGVSDINITLSDLLEEAELDFETGVSNISINIPKNVGCSIRSDAVLSGDYFEGFERKNNKFYQTPGFTGADKKIFIYIDGALSDFNVKRY